MEKANKLLHHYLLKTRLQKEGEHDVGAENMTKLKRIASALGFAFCLAVTGFALWGEYLLAEDHPLLEYSWFRNLCIAASCVLFVLTVWGFADDIRNKRQKLKHDELVK